MSESPQEEVTRLNLEGGKLVADRSQAGLAVSESQRLARVQGAKLEQIPTREQKLC
jgi:hypothetical protein